jgi:hypothetical protein
MLLLVYGVQIVVPLALGVLIVGVAVAYSVLNYPEVAWPLSPIFHRDEIHLGQT